ncbi:MAG: ribonuclease HII [Spirochaetota bacterium]
MLCCGIDEAGRGPLAGPVTAAAVVLTADFDLTILGDSKRLTPRRRELVANRIFSGACLWAAGWTWPEEIDRDNIHVASLNAMTRAFSSLLERIDTLDETGMLRRAAGEPCRIDHSAGIRGVPPRQDSERPLVVVRVDGKFTPPISAPCEAVVGGDGRIAEIMAASIVAKVLRDRWMRRYHEFDPRFGFASHKGYPSAAHKAALKTLGASPIHRRTFHGVPAHNVACA